MNIFKFGLYASLISVSACNTPQPPTPYQLEKEAKQRLIECLHPDTYTVVSQTVADQGTYLVAHMKRGMGLSIFLSIRECPTTLLLYLYSHYVSRKGETILFYLVTNFSCIHSLALFKSTLILLKVQNNHE